MTTRIQKWAGIVLLCGFVTFSAWAFLVSSNDFDPAYFKIANIGGSAKVTLIASSGGLTNNFIPALNGLGTNTTLEWLINGTFMDVLQTHDTHGIDLDYVKQDLSAITVLFRTVDGAMTFPNGFSFSGTASGGTFSGSGASLTGIPLSGIAQSGASGGQVAQWNGSGWVPTSPTNGTAIPITIQATNFVLNTVYTNNSGTVIGVDASIALHGAAVVGSSAMDLYADQNGGNNFTLQDRVAVSTLLTSIVTDYTNSLSGFITNLGTYYFTNSSTGAGNLSSIVPGTGEVITFGNIFAAGNVVLTTVEQTFITDQHFSGHVTVNNLVVSNGFAPGFTNVLAPTSSKTNFVWDASAATYYTYLCTNNVNIQYLTNTDTTHGVSGAAVSWRFFGNGADRTLTVNSNWVPLHTNIWTMVTSANPGYWLTTITNAADGNGPRWLLLSAVNFDSTFNQTNTIFDAVMSP